MDLPLTEMKKKISCQGKLGRNQELILHILKIFILLFLHLFLMLLLVSEIIIKIIPFPHPFSASNYFYVPLLIISQLHISFLINHCYEYVYGCTYVFLVNFPLKYTETTTENNNQSKCRAVRTPSLDTSAKQFLRLKLRKHRGRGVRKMINVRGPGSWM